jgi:hypothetical protein
MIAAEVWRKLFSFHVVRLYISSGIGVLYCKSPRYILPPISERKRGAGEGSTVVGYETVIGR